MKTKPHCAALLIILPLCAVLLPTAPTPTRAQNEPDPTGTWSWVTPIPPPAQARSTPARIPALQQRTTTLTLKLDGTNLTGTIFTQLSQPHTNAVPITDAKLDGNCLSFTVTRELNGQRYVQKFSGKLTADTIKGKVQFERNGQPQSADWVAQRVIQPSQDSPSGPTPSTGIRRSGPAPPQRPRAP